MRTFTKEELAGILQKHEKWLKSEDGGEKANLRYSNLSHSDLRGSNLSGSDLSCSDLRDSDLSGSDLDFSCWPLWCGSADVIIDERQAQQLMAHAMQVSMPYMEHMVNDELIAWANKFHHIVTREFPRIARRAGQSGIKEKHNDHQ